MSEPEIIVDLRAHHGQEKTFLEPFDFDDIPRKVKLSIHRTKGLDNVIREIRRPPREYVNIWVKLEYGAPVPLLFDVEGYPYIMAPAKYQETAPLLNAIVAGLKGCKPIEVQVCIREQHAEEILELLKVAKDFCDYCGKPLKTSGGPNSRLEHEAESVADVYNCFFCECESIRWSKDFLEWHPILQDMADAAHMELKTR